MDALVCRRSLARARPLFIVVDDLHQSQAERARSNQMLTNPFCPFCEKGPGMSEFGSQSSRRASQDSVRQHRRAAKAIAPFVGNFADWNRRAAQASAAVFSLASSERDRENHRQVLAALRSEVEASFRDFEAAVAGEPPHSRIDDIRHAFERLRDMVGQGN